MSNLLPSQGTKFVKAQDIKKDWILIDAEGQILGRLAARIAHRLRGKHKPEYAPHLDIGDEIIVVNAGLIKVTGNKMQQKLYYHHSNYPGGLKTATLSEKLEKDPVHALKKAVQRMLPSGPMGRRLMGNVRFYADTKHPHKAQQPEVWEPTYRY